MPLLKLWNLLISKSFNKCPSDISHKSMPQKAGFKIPAGCLLNTPYDFIDLAVKSNIASFVCIPPEFLFCSLDISSESIYGRKSSMECTVAFPFFIWMEFFFMCLGHVHTRISTGTTNHNFTVDLPIIFIIWIPWLIYINLNNFY